MMSKIIVFIIIAAVVISPIVVLVHTNSLNDSKSINYSQLNSEVRSSLTNMLNGNLVLAQSNGIHLNSDNIVNSTMYRFYLLENLSSFRYYYLNYSANFTVELSLSSNSSMFNSTDPYGLDLDNAYFVFHDIAEVNQSLTGGGPVPAIFKSVQYSINLGNGEISGPVTKENNVAYG